MSARKRPLFPNRDAAAYLGMALWLAGSVLLYDAYTNRGRPTPLPIRLAGAFT